MDNEQGVIHIRATKSFIDAMDAFISRKNSEDVLGRRLDRSKLIRALVEGAMGAEGGDDE